MTGSAETTSPHIPDPVSSSRPIVPLLSLLSCRSRVETVARPVRLAPRRMLLHGPERQRRGVPDEHAISGDERLSPGGAVRNGVPFQRRECGGIALCDDQLPVVIEQEEELAGFDDRCVCRLTRSAEPQRLPGSRIQSEVLAARAPGEPIQNVA